MYSNLNLDNKLINDNVIKILLKYDFTIYGCFVREVLFDNLIIFPTLFVTFLKKLLFYF